MPELLTEPLPELLESFSGHPEPLNAAFLSGVGDLDDLAVSLPEPKSERVSYQLVGRRYVEQEGVLTYPPAEIAADVTATAQIPWSNYTQDFTYRVTAYLERRFSFTVNGVADLNRGFAFRAHARFQTPDQVAHETAEDPVPATIREEESPKLLFPETLTERVEPLLEAWAVQNGYNRSDLDVLSRDVLIEESDRAQVTVESDHAYASTEGTHFEGAQAWTDQSVTAYDSPKTLTGLMIYDVPLVNSLGETLDQTLIIQGEVSYLYTLETDESEAAVLFSLSDGTTSTALNDFVEAAYDVTIESGDRVEQVIHPEEAVIPNPIQAAGAARYRLEILSATDGVTGRFRSSDGARESDTTDSVAGAWTTDPTDFMVFTVTSPESGYSTWVSQPPLRIVALANPAGDQVPAVVPVDPEVFAIPPEATSIQLSVTVAYGRLRDGSDVTGLSSARFASTGAPESEVFDDPSQLEATDLSVELGSSYSEEHTRQILIEETLEQGLGLVQIYGETVLSEIPVPQGYAWSSFLVRTSSPNVVLRTEVAGGKVRVLGRVSTSGGRWEPQVAPGTYYHHQLEYVKLKSPAFFTVRPDQGQDVETGGTVALLAGGKLLGRIRIQTPAGTWGHLIHRFKLADLLQEVEGKPVSGIEVRVESGPITAGLNADGILAIGESTAQDPSGTFHLTAGWVTLPVELPLSGPVMAWDGADPARAFFRLDDWAKESFEREIELEGTGHSILPLPIPYASLIAAFDGDSEITEQVDVLGPALVRPGGRFEFGRAYRVRLRARETFGLVGEGPELTLAFSENLPQIVVACEQAGSPRRSEELAIHVQYTDPATGQKSSRTWIPEEPPVTLFPFENPHDRGFLALSLEKRAPSSVRVSVEPKQLQPGLAGVPLRVVIRVDDARGNPVGGEAVRVTGSWLAQEYHARTDPYGFASIPLPGPGNPGAYTVTASVRSLSAFSEVIIR